MRAALIAAVLIVEGCEPCAGLDDWDEALVSRLDRAAHADEHRDEIRAATAARDRFIGSSRVMTGEGGRVGALQYLASVEPGLVLSEADIGTRSWRVVLSTRAAPVVTFLAPYDMYPVPGTICTAKRQRILRMQKRVREIEAERGADVFRVAAEIEAEVDAARADPERVLNVLPLLEGLPFDTLRVREVYLGGPEISGWFSPAASVAASKSRDPFRPDP